MLEYFDSMKESLKQKVTNPLLGTLFIIWTISNWKLVYALFTFDSDYTFEKRKEYISNHFPNWNESFCHSFYGNLIICIIWAFGTLIITYLLLYFSRIIAEKYEVSKGKVIEKYNPKKVKLRSEYADLENNFEKLGLKYKEERQMRLSNESTYESAEKEFLGKIEKLEKENSALSSELIVAKANFDTLSQGLVLPNSDKKGDKKISGNRPKVIEYPSSERNVQIEANKQFNWAVNINLADVTQVTDIIKTMSSAQPIVTNWKKNFTLTNYATLNILKINKETIDLLIVNFKEHEIDFRDGKILL